MPTELERKRGLKGWATIHPKGHPELYIHLALEREPGVRGGTSLSSGKVYKKKMHS